MSKVYSNPHQKNTFRGWFHFFLWRLGYYNDPYPIQPAPADFVFPNDEKKADLNKPSVTWINHSTFLISVEGKNFLVDPIWNERCSPFTFFGPKRYHAPGIDLSLLPPIDYVIISHNHYDHLDLETVSSLAQQQKKILWVIPKGLRKWFYKHLPSASLAELEWWESYTIDDPKNQEQVKFISVPAQHFSGRGLFDRNASLWMGCVVELIKGNKVIHRFYFAGDTGYNPYDFKKIGNELGPMDLSMLPIGVYTPRKFMRPVHVHPEEAVMIHKDVRSQLSIGGHFGTFHLSDEGLNRPPYDLYLTLKKDKIPFEEFRVLKPGQMINW